MTGFGINFIFLPFRLSSEVGATPGMLPKTHSIKVVLRCGEDGAGRGCTLDQNVVCCPMPECWDNIKFRYGATVVNLKRLQAFRAVFEAAAVTRAAERLHTTQPAVSRLIGDLEAELGLALFVRQRRRLVPTAEGRAFYPMPRRRW